MLLEKAQVARRQLGTALALFLEDLDPVSVHVLACGGGEIAEQIARKAAKKPFSTHILATFPEIKFGEVRALRNQYWNAFKHATARNIDERIDRVLLARFSDQQNDHTLFLGWYDFALAVGSLPVEAQVFEAWYLALYPEKLNPGVSRTPLEQIFPKLGELPRGQQKKKLREVIASTRSRADVMNDPRTDIQPLIVPS